MKMKMKSIDVEWDDNKDEINKQKHGIGFETAMYVFADKNRQEFYDDVHSTYDEDRYIVLGLIDKVLFVVYTMRGDSHRIISARLANERERRMYYGND